MVLFVPFYRSSIIIIGMQQQKQQQNVVLIKLLASPIIPANVHVYVRWVQIPIQCICRFAPIHEGLHGISIPSNRFRMNRTKIDPTFVHSKWNAILLHTYKSKHTAISYGNHISILNMQRDSWSILVYNLTFASQVCYIWVCIGESWWWVISK